MLFKDEPGCPEEYLLNFKEQMLMRYPLSYFYCNYYDFGIEGFFGQLMSSWCCQHNMPFKTSRHFHLFFN